jgi:hypothetical protein
MRFQTFFQIVVQPIVVWPNVVASQPLPFSYALDLFSAEILSREKRKEKKRTGSKL